jgi:nucleoside-diphosphate-sugar epimerase
MRVLVLGGTAFIGRRIVEQLHERGDQVLVVHRGQHEPDPWVPVGHLHTHRHQLSRHAEKIRDFAPTAVVDAYALTGTDVTAVLGVVPEVPTVVLSSQDVYQAYTGLRTGRCTAAVPLEEHAPLRADRYPYRGTGGPPGIPEDYEKLDVEQAWSGRGAVVLRLPMVYGPHDAQQREEVVLRRIRAGRTRMPIGAGNLLWSRAHVEDIATGVLTALHTPAAAGLTLNLGEPTTVPIRQWFQQIIEATGAALELVQVPEPVLPAELALTGAPAQHMLASTHRAQEVLGWSPDDPQTRVIQSVRWHLAHAPATEWTQDDTRTDNAALNAA